MGVGVGEGEGGWHALDILTGCSRGGRPGGPPPVPAPPALSLQGLPTPTAIFLPVILKTNVGINWSTGALRSSTNSNKGAP